MTQGEKMILAVAPEMRELGLSTAVLVARGLDNTKTPPELLAYRRAAGQRLAGHWRNRSISAHPAIREYHRVHEMFGVSDEAPAPEKLILYVRRNRDFTSAGAVVDCYNIVSARTLLSIGAHDLDRLDLPITLRRITETDVFQPLGTVETKRVAGEFGYIDMNGRVICRLDVLQCEWSKVIKDTRSVALFVQGNRCLSPAMLLKGSWLLAEMVTKFCGGEIELVDFLDAGSPAPSEMVKPQITIEAFKHMTLETGTVVRVTPINGLSLSVVTVRTTVEIDALAPQGATEAATAGQKVAVAVGLHPLVVAGQTFTAYLPTLHVAGGTSVTPIVNSIPEGKRLY
jgi:DNA/RNA-binding domain of Phe-tRNA-synthetase-like protein